MQFLLNREGIDRIAHRLFKKGKMRFPRDF